jgi:hypothetical protein
MFPSKEPQEADMHLRQLSPVDYSLSDEWKVWIAENKILGLDDHRLVEILVEGGIDEQVAADEVAAITAHPVFQVAWRMAQKNRKLESLLNVYSDLARLRPSARFKTIERRSNVSRDEFLERYYAANRPVVLLNLMNDWKALRLWEPEYFKSSCGNETVEVMGGRNSDPRYEINSDSHRTTMLFREYIDKVTRNSDGNDYYLVANNNMFQRKGMQHLYDDIVVFPEYLDKDNLDGGVFFWFGPAGTVTPLHHDVLNVFMSQVRGRKRVTLIPSEQIHRVYNDIGVYSEVDCEKPDYSEFPEFRNAPIQRFVLKPGEVLFVPVGWWHHVRALDISVTVSFTNFIFPNYYEWTHPDIRK